MSRRHELVGRHDPRRSRLRPRSEHGAVELFAGRGSRDTWLGALPGRRAADRTVRRLRGGRMRIENHSGAADDQQPGDRRRSAVPGSGHIARPLSNGRLEPFKPVGRSYRLFRRRLAQAVSELQAVRIGGSRGRIAMSNTFDKGRAMRTANVGFRRSRRAVPGDVAAVSEEIRDGGGRGPRSTTKDRYKGYRRLRRRRRCVRSTAAVPKWRHKSLPIRDLGFVGRIGANLTCRMFRLRKIEGLASGGLSRAMPILSAPARLDVQRPRSMSNE